MISPKETGGITLKSLTGKSQIPHFRFYFRFFGHSLADGMLNFEALQCGCLPLRSSSYSFLLYWLPSKRVTGSGVSLSRPFPARCPQPSFCVSVAMMHCHRWDRGHCSGGGHRPKILSVCWAPILGNHRSWWEAHIGAPPACDLLAVTCDTLPWVCFIDCNMKPFV